MTILYFFIVLGVLIFVHELGHFLMAKREDVYVETFSFGFGPRLFGIKYGETDYRVSLLPFGGYVKMMGEDLSDKNAVVNPRSLTAKSIWARVKIMAMGPIMNLVLALLIMPAVYMIGKTEPAFLREKPVIIDVKDNSPAERAGLLKGDVIVSLDGKKVKEWNDVMLDILISPKGELKVGVLRGSRELTKTVALEESKDKKMGYAGFEPSLFIGEDPVIGFVAEGSSAAEAGLKPGDRVLSLGGREVKYWSDVTEIAGENGDNVIPIGVKRGDETINSNLTPKFNEKEKRYQIGIAPGVENQIPEKFVRFGFVDALKEGTKENYKLTVLTFLVLKRIVTNQLSYQVIGGPVLIAKASAAAAAAGLSQLLFFMAYLSLNLFMLNLLPLPILDGGQLVYLAIEAIFRRPLNPRVRMVFDQLGFALLVALMLFVTFNDLNNLWGIGNLIKKLF